MRRRVGWFTNFKRSGTTRGQVFVVTIFAMLSTPYIWGPTIDRLKLEREKKKSETLVSSDHECGKI